MSQPFKDARVLVTGGCGFIGSHLVERLLECGAEVAVVDNFSAGRSDNLPGSGEDIRLIEADLRDAGGIKQIVSAIQPRFVFHLAANASVPGSVADPEYDFQANCAGTFALLDALRHCDGCERIVLASSGAVYGQPTSFPISEEDPLLPISPYGASKLNAETTARMFQRVYGIPTTIARIFNTYGPRMGRFVLLDFLHKLQRDSSVLEVLGSGRQVRDFTYVADTVEGLLLLCTRGIPGEAYNLSSGVSCSVCELARRLIALLELTQRTQIVFTGTSWIGDAQHWEVSIRKIADLGYTPRVSLDEGLSRTNQWFRADPNNQ